MADAFEKGAKEVIETINYLTLATATKDGLPWNTPVCFGYDTNYNFYWASDTQSIHSQNIAANNNVFFVIFDSTKKPGTNKGRGVFIKAKAYMLEKETEVAHALACLYRRLDDTSESPHEFLGTFPRRMYKAIPESIWVNGHGERNGEYIDTRIKVTLP